VKPARPRPLRFAEAPGSAAPAARMKDRRLAGLVPELLDACAGISHTLGARSLPGVDVRFRARAAVAAADRRR
jgi:hypothetical protein